MLFSRGLDARILLAASLFASLTLRPISAVDAAKFRTCEQGSFCRRYRKHVQRVLKHEGGALHELDDSSLEVLPSKAGVRVGLRTPGASSVAANKADTPLNLEVHFHKESLLGSCGIIRVKINEVSPLYPRFQVPPGDVILEEELLPDEVSIQQENGFTVLQSKSGDCSAKLRHSPFEISISAFGHELQRLNAKQLLNFERYRANSSQPPSGLADATSADVTGLWREAFDGHTDTKPRGPAAVGIDVSFPRAVMASGLAEHATRLDLTASDYEEPFRLFNLDVFEYIVDSPMALYGSVPFLTAVHNNETGGEGSQGGFASGLFIANSAEGFVKLSEKSGGIDTWWIFESGILDIFCFAGPHPEAVLQQYHTVTGLPRLPPLFTLGKHQSRWNYVDVEDAIGVMEAFDQHAIPFDVLWLDLEHTEGKKYFTWDAKHFSDPAALLIALANTSRQLVTIVDPHVKEEAGYGIYDALVKDGFFTTSMNASVYKGFCWPGVSNYPDFCNPATRARWSTFFLPDVYPHSASNLYTWNDMNEPSVFDGPEVTMPRDNLHRCTIEGQQAVEHRDMHNLYGLYVHAASVQGQLLRNPDRRPFVLTRSFFAGSHRHGAAWTGDSTASWPHLEYSVPMLLSLSLCGLSFAGVDVPGFFGDPDPELFLRWHQLGIWYPFYRGHAHLTTKRREPWMFGESITTKVRRGIIGRYRLLPYWYTLYAEWAMFGHPILRPLWYNDLQSVASLRKVDSEFFVGNAIYVAAIVRPSVKGMELHLPSGKWFPFWDSKGNVVEVTNSQPIRVKVNADFIPAYIRCGSILPMKIRPRRSTVAMAHDPYTLYIYGDTAKGRVYLDDGMSHDFEAGAFLYDDVMFDGEQLSIVEAPLSGPMSGKRRGGKMPLSKIDVARRIERVIFIGLSKAPQAAWLVTTSKAQVSSSDHGKQRRALSMKVEAHKAASSQYWTATLREPGLAFGNYSMAVRLE